MRKLHSATQPRPDTASGSRRTVRAHAYRPPNAITLVRAYRWFVRISDAPHIISRRVPRTPAGRTQYLVNELGTWAYEGLSTIIPPRTDGARALLMATVPDLVFARLDRFEPTQLLRQLDAAVLDRWESTSRQLAMDARHKLELTIPAAVAIVRWRMEAEAPYHRPLDTFYEDGSLIR